MDESKMEETGSHNEINNTKLDTKDDSETENAESHNKINNPKLATKVSNTTDMDEEEDFIIPEIDLKSKDDLNMEKAESLIKIYNTKQDPKVSNPGLTAFIGPILSGKSTLINFLLNNLKVTFDSEEEDFIISKIDDSKGPAINSTYCGNQTLLPEVEIPGTDLHIIEFPGVNENGNLEEAIQNCVNVRKKLGKTSVKLVFIFPIDMMKNNPYPLMEMFSKLNNTSEVCLIATKAEKGNLEKMLINLSNMEFSNAEEPNAEVLSNAKKLLGRVLNGKTFFSFGAPKSEMEPGWDLDELLKVINNVKGGEINISDLILNAQSRIEFLKLCEETSKKAEGVILEYIKSSCEQEVKHNFPLGENEVKEFKNNCLKWITFDVRVVRMMYIIDRLELISADFKLGANSLKLTDDLLREHLEKQITLNKYFDSTSDNSWFCWILRKARKWRNNFIPREDSKHPQITL